MFIIIIEDRQFFHFNVAPLLLLISPGTWRSHTLFSFHFLFNLSMFFFFLRFYFLLNFDEYHKMYYIPARMDGFVFKENMLVVNSLLIQFKISFSILWCLVNLQLCMFGCWESSRKLIEENSVKIEKFVVWNKRSVPKLRFKLEIWVCYWITF
jgi:hypothetical protein